MIRVAELPALAKQKRRIELLEDAFVLASRAREPWPRRTLPGAAPDSAEAVLAEAYKLELDALSLQTRALRALQAPGWIERLSRPPGEPLTCADRLVWDTAAYWQTISELKLFPPPRSIVSPLEIQPAVEMIRQAEPKRIEPLMHWLLDGLERLGEDDRAFSASIRNATRALEFLAMLCPDHGLPATPVLAALSRYLSRNLSAHRCQDTLEVTRPAASAVVSYFNERLRKPGHLGNAELPPIEHELEPAAVLDRVPPEPHPKWLLQYRTLTEAPDHDAIADSKLQDEQPLVWFLLAKPFDRMPDSRHAVMAAYSRLKALQR
ncbi:MAG: hypothetical protein HY235_25195 [Acidobacteria bacterium]|nr:hypothetical protein [Acidobacteriota bacterium]